MNSFNSTRSSTPLHLKLIQNILPLGFGAVASLTVLLLWYQLEVRESNHIAQVTHQEAITLNTALSRDLTNQVQSLQRMADRWRANGGTQQALWEADAAAHIRDLYGFQAIEWVDPSFRVRWVVPLEGNEAALNLDLNGEFRRQTALRIARDLRQSIVTGTITLKQGGKGFLVMVPLFVNQSEQLPPRFDGFIVGVFRVPSLFDSILRKPEGFQVRISDGDTLIFKSTRTLPRSFRETVLVEAYGVNWQVEIAPTPEFIQKERSPLPYVVLFGGLVGVWGFVLTLSLARRANQYAEQANWMNQALQRNAAHLKEKEKRYRQLIDHLNAGFVIHALDTSILSCNTTACTLLGLSMEQMLGKTAIDPDWHFLRADGTIMPIEDYPVNRVLHTQTALQNYVLGIGIGSQLQSWVLVTAFPEFHPNGQLEHVVVTCIDITNLKQAEANLREMAQVLENAVSGIAKVDEQGRYIYINKNYANTIGYQPEEMLEMPWTQTVHPDDMEKMVTAYQHMQQTGQAEVEARGIRKDGSIFYKQLVMISIYSNAHQFIGHHCFMKDISERARLDAERLQVEQALRHSEATKQGIIQAIPDLLIRMQVDGTYLDLITNSDSPILKDHLIHKGIHATEALPPELVQERIYYAQQALQTGTLQVYEQQILIAGQSRHEEVRIVPLLPDQVLVMVRDITHRKQAEAALRHQKEMFQAIVDHIPIMIAWFNAQGQIEFINPELERILGWPLESWRQQDLLTACYPDPVYRQTVLDHMLTATGKWKDMVTLTATGQPIETTWANVRLSSGDVLGIGQDISDRKQKERALQEAMEAAEAANLAKSTFLATMSHELRTPLNVILGFAQVLAHDSALTPNQQADLQTIRRSGDHLLNLINDVLDLSKIEAGHFTLKERGFDFIALLHTLRTMLTERTTAKGLELQFDIDPSVPQFIIADDQKIRQVLLNLVSNAIKFTQQGQVILRVSLQDIENLEQGELLAFPFFSTDHTLCFQVTDTGPGIAPDELRQVFDAFVQAEAGRRATSGTGLGLTISRKLVELMQGTITVTSTIGQGSTFTVTLPICPATGVDIAPERGDRLILGLAPGQPHRRILVVDDQAENRLLLVRLLARVGLEVREASNGEEAIYLWQDWHPDLIWMDIRMPTMDGYEATKQIRALEHHSNSIIIALTAQASQSDRTLALAAGCNDYISKPFREETLFLKLEEYLGVKFLYETVNPALTTQSTLPSPPKHPARLGDLKLAALPPDWLKQLENAAICGDDLTIEALVAELAPELATLKEYVTDLAHRYQFEQILNLIHAHSSGG